MLPTTKNMRLLGQLFCTRAMLHVSEGRIAAARADICSCFRLSHLMTQGPMMIETMVAYANHNQAVEAAIAWLSDPRVTAADVEKLRAELSPLAPFPSLDQKAILVERYATIDILLKSARYGPDAILVGSKNNSFHSHFTHHKMSGLNWDAVLREINAQYDRMTKILSVADRFERNRLLQAFNRDLVSLMQQINERVGQLIPMNDDERALWIGRLLYLHLFPAMEMIQLVADKATQKRQLLQVALALTLYQRATGQYPHQLSELVPQYLPAIPGDYFSDKELLYRREGEGCLVYSVGPDGVDQKGLDRESDKDQTADDIVVRLVPWQSKVGD